MLMFIDTAQNWLETKQVGNDSDGSAEANSGYDSEVVDSLKNSEEAFEVSDEATGLMTPKEEMEYRSTHFD